ncbi:MAG: hypothetical protein JSV47_11490, partial [Deltaproteobacteria bacterium]
MPTLRQLRRRSPRAQFARDVNMWNRTLKWLARGHDDDAWNAANSIIERIFITLQNGGLFYREQNTIEYFMVGVSDEKPCHGGWQFWCERPGYFPIAAALSHGGRVIIQTPLNDNRRFWNWLTVGATDLHDRSVDARKTKLLGPLGAQSDTAPLVRRFASHGTDRDAPKPRLFGTPARKLIAEVKKKSPFKHGNQWGMDIAMGGYGQNNPDSGDPIYRDGTHGHIYLYYRHGGSGQCDVVMIGCEGSAPRKRDQYGGLHDAAAGSGEFSPTGGLKWRDLRTGPGCRFYDGVYWKDHPGDKKHKKARSKKCAKGDITADTMMIVLED